MVYEFICPKCNKTKEVDVLMREISEYEVFCKCKTKMIRNWNASIHIPYGWYTGENEIKTSKRRRKRFF